MNCARPDLWEAGLGNWPVDPTEVVMAPTSQRLESPGKPGRFSAYLFRKSEVRLGSVQRDDLENRSSLLYGGGGRPPGRAVPAAAHSSCSYSPAKC